MANKSLNDKYGIPFMSEWKHKDGGVYMAMKIEHTFGDLKIPTVSYLKILNDEDREYFIANNIKNQFVRTVEHFKNSFTLINP